MKKEIIFSLNADLQVCDETTATYPSTMPTEVCAKPISEFWRRKT